MGKRSEKGRSDTRKTKHQLTAGKAATMLRMFLPMLVLTVFLFQAQFLFLKLVWPLDKSFGIRFVQR